MIKEKDTNELEKMLENVKHGDFDKYLEENAEDIIDETNEFEVYMKDLFKDKKMSQTKVFAFAQISQGYGYKLLTGEKRTKQRDTILRLCYAAEFTIDETQRALKKYKMPTLYAKDERDAFIMIMFNERPGNIYDVNELLIAENLEPIRECGETN